MAKAPGFTMRIVVSFLARFAVGALAGYLVLVEELEALLALAPELSKLDSSSYGPIW